MALINCPECNKEVSDKAEVCIHCGYPLNNSNHNEIKEYNEKSDLNQIIKNIIIEKIEFNNEPMLSTSIKKELYLMDKNYTINLENILRELIEEGKIETSFNGALRYGIASGNKAIPKLKTAPRMIKCPNCDNKIYETATTCSYCGLQDVKSALLEKERKMESTKPIDTLIQCPKCGSTQIQAVPRKWSLMTGFLTNKIDRVCLNCKHKF